MGWSQCTTHEKLIRAHICMESQWSMRISNGIAIGKARIRNDLITGFFFYLETNILLNSLLLLLQWMMAMSSQNLLRLFAATTLVHNLDINFALKSFFFLSDLSTLRFAPVLTSVLQNGKRGKHIWLHYY